MKVRFERKIAAPLEKVIAAFRSSEFYAEKQKASGALTVEILEEEDLAGGRYRMKARVSEPSRLPSFLRQGDVDTYTDDTLLDPGAGVMTWTVTPAIFPDKFFLSGKVEFRAAGDSTTVVYNTDLVVKVPFVGGKAEKIGLAKTEEEVNKQAAFLSRWVETH